MSMHSPDGRTSHAYGHHTGRIPVSTVRGGPRRAPSTHVAYLHTTRKVCIIRALAIVSHVGLACQQPD